MINLIFAMNIYQQSFISFFVVMTIVGFFLIYADKKKWKEYCARSAEMMEKKKPQSVETDSAVSENEAVVDDNAKTKKKKKKKEKIPTSGEFEYNRRLNDRVLIALAVFLCGLGELIGMIVFRHKWYKIQYKIGMPLIALLNIFAIIVAVIACREVGGDGIIKFFA